MSSLLNNLGTCVLVAITFFSFIACDKKDFESSSPSSPVPDPSPTPTPVWSATAKQELGQYVFETSTAGTTDAMFNAPSASVYDDVNHRLFVVDTTNNRIMVFNADLIDNGESAVHVLGQANFTSSSSGITASTLSAPSGVAYDSARQYLFVSDSGNHRILEFWFTIRSPSSPVKQLLKC